MYKIKFLTLPLTKKERAAKTYSSLKKISKTPEKVSRVTLVTNYHELSFLSLVVRP